MDRVSKRTNPELFLTSFPMNGFREVVFPGPHRVPWSLMKKLLTYPCKCSAQRSARFTVLPFNSSGRITNPPPMSVSTESTSTTPCAPAQTTDATKQKQIPILCVNFVFIAMDGETLNALIINAIHFQPAWPSAWFGWIRCPAPEYRGRLGQPSLPCQIPSPEFLVRHSIFPPAWPSWRTRWLVPPDF